MDMRPALLGAVFKATGNTAPLLASPAKGAARLHCAQVHARMRCESSGHSALHTFPMRDAVASSDANSGSTHECSIYALRGKVRGCKLAHHIVQVKSALWRCCAGKYLLRDIERSAACNAVPFSGLPSNSRAQPAAETPYLSGLLALRVLAALRMGHVRCSGILRGLPHTCMI